MDTQVAHGAPALNPLTDTELNLMHAYWRACNYLSVGMIYLKENPLLTEPLKTQGILYFTPPAPFEKHVTAPQDERYLIQGDKVVFENKGKAINRSLSLQDYPVLRALVEAFRSTLTNDVVTLKRFYLVTLQGTPRRWVLILHPLNKAVQELVESIRFSGEEEQLRSIETRAPDGDRSLMVITSGAQ